VRTRKGEDDKVIQRKGGKLRAGKMCTQEKEKRGLYVFLNAYALTLPTTAGISYDLVLYS